MIGKTNSLSGGGIKGETLKVSLRTNQSSHSDLNGVAFTFEYADSSERYVWEGSDIIIKIPPYLSYTITPEDVDGYKTPSVYSSISIDGFQKTATLEYQCTIVTVKSDDNQPDYNDVSASTATVSASGMTTKTISNGNSVKVPTGNVCTISWSSVNGYRTPDTQTFTASGTSVTKTGTYQTEILTVNVSGISSEKSYQITVSGIGSQTTSSKTYKIPFGMSYTISASNVSGYSAPSSQSFTANSVSRTITMEYLKEAVDLSMQDVFGNPISRSTANSYVIREIGEYKFPLVFGNAIKNGSTNSSAYTKVASTKMHDFVDYKGNKVSSPYIESVSGVSGSAQLTISDTDGIFTDISIIDGSPCRYIKFKVNSIPTVGANGIISVKNEKGVIMWSWLIWVWTDDLTPVEIENSTGVKYKIMPFNLASKWDEESKEHIKNWYYQYGRATPVICASSYNSTTNHASFGENFFYSASTAGYLYDAIKEPWKFYENTGNWFNNNYQVYNLWDANCSTYGASDNIVVKSIYDPCPIGFRMPNGNTFTGFSISNVIGSFDNGWYFKRNKDDTEGVYFPATGYRQLTNGNRYGGGKEGYIWTSAHSSAGSPYYLEYTSSRVRTGSSGGDGYSVRPVKED